MGRSPARPRCHPRTSPVNSPTSLKRLDANPATRVSKTTKRNPAEAYCPGLRNWAYLSAWPRDSSCSRWVFWPPRCWSGRCGAVSQHRSRPQLRSRSRISESSPILPALHLIYGETSSLVAAWPPLFVICARSPQLSLSIPAQPDHGRYIYREG